ncbi:RagB/SusD family nutrient uptake outer membrane protein [Sphingobacterium alkalisoli]|uniref:RagB/SusD family nutrient uptake outer membrane protein n=1 Tax=Sphingobacterium alkalisoli TaxID=1874115 RepID=A0A4U0H603_9SPHI|nr:RagB/SusD family nutrient uptake outer membrane protein [Sphingobacterium alkalisoli]TJY65762.1 RagB/SusD family nutrient uptake outer membrane protein [Sphingobacterium alkalisoli]GGH18485.1 membrane protein [Sphingobacterium alkalisoli]
MIKLLNYMLFLIPFMMTGCDKFLAVEVPDNLTHDEYWANREQVVASMNGMYSSLHNNLNRFQVWGDSRSSLYTPGPGDSFTTDYRQFMAQDIYPENGLLGWGSVYTAITWINSFIKNAPGALERDQTFTESELNVMMGEAYALRALNYFYLVRTFKEVPIIEQPYESDSQQFNTAASSEEEVLNFIEADLDRALSAVAPDFENINERYGRITKNTVKAIWADVKLWRNEYQACLDLCADLSAVYGDKLVEPLNWFSIFSPGNSSEGIFEYQYVQTGFASPLYNWFSHFQQNNAKYLANIANIQVNAGEKLYLPTDPLHFSADTIRLKNYSAFRFSPVSYAGGSGYEVYKFIGQSPYELNYRPTGARNANYIIYRYREILFMEAEALAMLNRYEEAEARINKIRLQCNIPAVSTGVMGADLEFMTNLLMEREFELGFEGKEWFAAVRIARRSGFADALIVKAAENNPLGESYQVVRARLLNPESWFLPYHRTELESNRLLVQKDYYKNK